MSTTTTKTDSSKTTKATPSKPRAAKATGDTKPQTRNRKAATPRTRGDKPAATKVTSPTDAKTGRPASAVAVEQAAKKPTAESIAAGQAASKKLAETEKVKNALRRANLSPNSEINADQRQRALKAPSTLSGAPLRDHIMGNGKTKAQTDGRITGKQAAEKVLAEHDGPMKISELARNAVAFATAMAGKTPEQSIARDVLMDAKRDADKRTFIKVGKGLYDLQARNPQATAPEPAPTPEPAQPAAASTPEPAQATTPAAA